MDKGIKTLLDAIAKAEGHGRPLTYDTSYAYGKYNGGTFYPSRMSLGAVKALQKRMIANQAGRKLRSSAIGRYQFIQKTLRACQKAFGHSDNILFSPVIQDKYAAYLLHIRGFDRWRDSKMSTAQFQNNLAKEWASIPNTKGRSHYGQGVGISNATLQKALRGARDRTPISGYGRQVPQKRPSFFEWLADLFERWLS